MGIDARVESAAGKIERIEIQGAANIARAALDAIRDLLETRRAITGNALKQNCDRLVDTRPTEPMLQNAMRFILEAFEERGTYGALETCKKLGGVLGESRGRIAGFGRRIIGNGSTVFTHCHSSSVVEIFRRARRDGKKFSVICTETRPLFQGHRTVRDTLSLGIPVTLIVDSAANFFMKECDVVLVGCDAFVPEGLINKIGTSMVALSAREHKKPLYCALSLLKFTEKCEIEERSPSEITTEFREKRGLKIRNPSFDLTPARYITGGAITEVGILKPSQVGRAAKIFIHNV